MECDKLIESNWNVAIGIGRSFVFVVVVGAIGMCGIKFHESLWRKYISITKFKQVSRHHLFMWYMADVYCCTIAFFLSSFLSLHCWANIERPLWFLYYIQLTNKLLFFHQPNSLPLIELVRIDFWFDSVRSHLKSGFFWKREILISMLICHIWSKRLKKHFQCKRKCALPEMASHRKYEEIFSFCTI